VAALAGASGTPRTPSAVHGLAALSSADGESTAEAGGAQLLGSPGPQVGTGTFDGTSPSVGSLPVLQVPLVSSIVTRDNESLHPGTQPSNVKDPKVQSKKGTGPISAPIQSFDGICLPDTTCAPGQRSDCSCLPPDTNGDVGTNQYVQMVNASFAVYSKNGALLRAATNVNQLWTGTGTECERHNDGDPVVVYDQLAKRWLLSQFISDAQSGEQYGECIAISTSNDATGSYYLYTFRFGSDVFYDYPKIGVWPDGYYMTANEFPGDQPTSSGAAAFVLERSRMLAGQPARYVLFDESAYNPTGGQYVGQLPADLDGTLQPPRGAPGLVAEIDDPTSIPPTGANDSGFALRLWQVHVDWADPDASTFGANGAPSHILPVAPFARPQCVYGYGPNCIPQKGAPLQLDTLGDRLMFRLAYRNLGDHASLVLNHSVVADGRVGIRWYEVRFPSGGAPSIYQQGTYAPGDPTTNPLWRWMGSVAMDHSGDIALAFSASGPNDYPSIRYTGRAAADPPGELTQTEQIAYTGSGPQTEAEGRWGDYGDLTVDPVDDCTFWYTQQYLGPPFIALGSLWRTRVVAFAFPGCKK
jgi:hypothetical protein